MTIAIHRRLRQQRSMIGVGLVAVLTVATVVALRLDSRPITVTDDPAPAVQSGALDPAQSAATVQPLRDVEIHQKWLESVRNGAIGSGQAADAGSNAATFTETPSGGLVRTDVIGSGQAADSGSNAATFIETSGGGLVRGDAGSGLVPQRAGDASLPATVPAQPAGAGNGFGALPAR
jgi:hypothetical protein